MFGQCMAGCSLLVRRGVCSHNLHSLHGIDANMREVLILLLLGLEANKGTKRKRVEKTGGGQFAKTGRPLSLAHISYLAKRFVPIYNGHKYTPRPMTPELRSQSLASEFPLEFVDVLCGNV